jgi:DNA repair protein RAD50
MQNYNDHIAEQKRKRMKIDSQLQALEEEISSQRSAHMKKVSEHGQLAAEAKVG